MGMKRFGVAALALLAIAVAPGVATGAQAIACGDVVSTDTILSTDLVCQGDGLIVSESVVLDLNGHTIAGDTSGSGISLSGSDSIVKNGTVHGFDFGIAVTEGQDQLIEDMEVRGNRIGVFVFEEVQRLTINRNVITQNTSHGIFLLEFVTGAVVTKNHLTSNGGHGIGTAHAVDDARYENNVFMKNAGDGLHIENSTSEIIGNRFFANGGDGLFVSEEFSGFYQHYSIYDNVADRNAVVGIRVLPTSDGELPTNVGGNAAKHNGVAQCINIDCAYNRGLAKPTAPVLPASARPSR